MTGLARIVIRTWAFLAKETIVAVQQPRLLLIVIVGPFLLLLLFAVGFTNNAQTFDTVLVVPNRSGVPTNVATYQNFFFFSLHLVGVTTDETAALNRLRAGKIDAVVVAPADPLAELAGNQPAEFQVYYDSLNPVERTQLNGLVYAHTRELNTLVVAAMLSGVFQAAGVPQTDNSSAVDELRQQLLSGNSGGALAEIDRLLAVVAILRLSGEGGQLPTVQAALNDLAGSLSAQPGVSVRQAQDLQTIQQTAAGLPDLLQAAASVSPERLAAPTSYTLTNLAPTPVGVTRFYSPAVVMLLLQHIALTLAALSVVRERTRGTVELFEVAPIRLSEILLGKALSFIIIIAALAAVLLALLVLVLGVPFLGSPGWAALVVVLLATVSIAGGFSIGALSKTETQAVQLAMLVLLFSIFFGGIFVQPFALIRSLQIASYVIPMKEAGDVIRDVMLRGEPTPILSFAILAGMAPAAITFAYALMRRVQRIR